MECIAFIAIKMAFVLQLA